MWKAHKPSGRVVITLAVEEWPLERLLTCEAIVDALKDGGASCPEV